MLLGHLIALISNAHLVLTLSAPLEGFGSRENTRHDEHYSERPEVEINPNWSSGCSSQALAGAAGRGCPTTQAYLLFTMSMNTA